MLVALKESEGRDFLEIIHRRHKKASTIFCSQFAPAGWHKKIGEAVLADAILIGLFMILILSKYIMTRMGDP